MFDSKNFFVTLINIVFALLASNGITVDLSGEQTFEGIVGKNFATLAVFLFVNFFNPVLKIVNKIISKTFDWSFLKSDNFKTQVLTLANYILLGFIYDEMFVANIVAIILNVWNLISHWLETKSNKGVAQPTAKVLGV